ncbi:MAG: hypothetical protein HYZ53_20825 [Planctomycetes bacterium]|nr:hypothetical protein [Planctomycetota bacterium]
MKNEQDKGGSGKEASPAVVRLVGLRHVTFGWTKADTIISELRLNDEGKVVVVSGEDTGAADEVKNGIELAGDVVIAHDLGKKYGVTGMVSRRYTGEDGARFLVAVLSVYSPAKCPTYGCALPIEERATHEPVTPPPNAGAALTAPGAGSESVGPRLPRPEDSDGGKVQDAKAERARRGFANAAGMSFGLLRSEVRAVDGGWRSARIFDEGFEGWLCPHVHATPEEADKCPEQESVLGAKRS